MQLVIANASAFHLCISRVLVLVSLFSSVPGSKLINSFIHSRNLSSAFSRGLLSSTLTKLQFYVGAPPVVDVICIRDQLLINDN